LSNVEGSNLIFTLGLRYLSNVVTNNEKAIQDIQSASIKNELRRYALQYDYVAAALQRMNNILEQEMNPFQKKYAEHMRLMVSTNSVELLNEIYNDKDFQNSIHLIDGYFDDSLIYNPAEAKQVYERMLNKPGFLALLPNIIQSQIGAEGSFEDIKQQAIDLKSMIQNELKIK
jgi:hypothetical protein